MSSTLYPRRTTVTPDNNNTSRPVVGQDAEAASASQPQTPQEAAATRRPQGFPGRIFVAPKRIGFWEGFWYDYGTVVKVVVVFYLLVGLAAGVYYGLLGR
jgi:hypothetical protein